MPARETETGSHGSEGGETETGSHGSEGGESGAPEGGLRRYGVPD